MKATIINVGDELLIGQVVNTNASKIATFLTGAGVEVEEIIVVPDDKPAITGALERAFEQSDVLILTGGLGPTKDDVTKHALVDLFGSELVFYPEVFERLTAIFRSFGREPKESHRQQCYLPSNARLIENGKGTAPGMHFTRKGKHLFVLPGVPYEMVDLMKKRIVPELLAIFDGGGKLEIRTICTAGRGESDLAERLAPIEDTLSPNLKLAYLPRPGRVRIRLMGRLSTEEEVLEYERVYRNILDSLGSVVYAEEDIPLAEAIGRELLRRNARVAVAESCTGGYLGHMFTRNPGSSQYFEGGAIVYSNELKQDILGVSTTTLERYGAVSQQTVEEMVRGAVKAFQVDYAIAVSGIAGPDGGSEEKPVGTVWIAVGKATEVVSRRFQFSIDRMRNIEMSAVAGLNMLRKFLINIG